MVDENIDISGLVAKIGDTITQIDSYPQTRRPYKDLFDLARASLPHLSRRKDKSLCIWVDISGILSNKYVVVYKSQPLDERIVIMAVNQPENTPIRSYKVTRLGPLNPFCVSIREAKDGDVKHLETIYSKFYLSNE